MAGIPTGLQLSTLPQWGRIGTTDSVPHREPDVARRAQAGHVGSAPCAARSISGIPEAARSVARCRGETVRASLLRPEGTVPSTLSTRERLRVTQVEEGKPVRCVDGLFWYPTRSSTRPRDMSVPWCLRLRRDLHVTYWSWGLTRLARSDEPLSSKLCKCLGDLTQTVRPPFPTQRECRAIPLVLAPPTCRHRRYLKCASISQVVEHLAPFPIAEFVSCAAPHVATAANCIATAVMNNTSGRFRATGAPSESRQLPLWCALSARFRFLVHNHAQLTDNSIGARTLDNLQVLMTQT